MRKLFILLTSATLFAGYSCSETNMPLPEHPRPDFQREAFINLNGCWDFSFNEASFDRSIIVPFPWGSKLSTVEDGGDIAWYRRSISIPRSWKGKRVFIVVGASDWETSAWLDGKEIGSHQGGYTPFEFEITELADFGKKQELKIKADDSYADWHLYGKQGYGNARGIWQTVYLEARGSSYVSSLHFSPDIDREVVKVEATIEGECGDGDELKIEFRNGEYKACSGAVNGGKASFEIALPGQHLWDIDDPYLYEITASLTHNGRIEDKVDSYFGQRKIGTVKVPGQNYTYVALNNKPVYLKLCLDQSYHPDGFYTFPSDEFMKNEILLSKKLGLNGNRIHIKTEVPRKLYWADKLGLLIMADVPNPWGKNCGLSRNEWERCMREQVERDFNHPSIFAWVDFNETWGLWTDNGDGDEYVPDTQEWVRSMYKLTKSLDPTRLVEDNSACNGDHVQTDINSWHHYLPAYRWEGYISHMDEITFPGSTGNYIGGNTQGEEPMINSECGNVWGYHGSAGDCDYTWDYHEMMNAFHRHPKVGGWLYTEHHDVINEWNGYVRYDRSEKIDGLDEVVPGMEIKDFHSDYYIVPMGDFHKDASAGSVETVEIMSSFTTDKDPGEMTLVTKLCGMDYLGRTVEGQESSRPVAFKPFCLAKIEDLQVKMPGKNGMYVLQMVLKNSKGEVLHRNFNLFRVKDGECEAPNCISFSPSAFTASYWSIKQTSVMNGLKVNGFGSGFFEYTLPAMDSIPGDGSARLIFEASAKKLFGKDVDDGTKINGEFMLGEGTFDSCKNRNAYAMTDTELWPSELKVNVCGTDCGTFSLEDDPADARGLLSWHSQLNDKYMREAGSYGYLVCVDIPAGTLKAGLPIPVRISVPESSNGGLAIYGEDFGRYPFDPTLIFDAQ